MSWVKLHRSLKDWEWYDDINATRLLIHLLLSVNYEPKKWKGITIPAGSMIFSWDSLSKQLGLSVKQCRIAMSKLEKSGEAARKAALKGQLVTLIKWDKLQNKETQEARKGAVRGQEEGKKGATTKEIKNNRTKEEKEKREKKSRFAPPSLLDVQNYISEKGYNVNAERFIAFYESNGWKVGKNSMKSWKAAVVTWQSREKEKDSAQKEKHLSSIDKLRAMNQAIENGQISFSDE